MLPDSDFMDTIKGFLDRQEGQRLYALALEAGRLGPCLEVGSYCGKSAVYLGCGCRENQTILFSIDHHRGSEEQQPGQEYFDAALYNPEIERIDTLPIFRRTLALAGLENTVVPIVSASAVAARAWKTLLGLVFIDGGHAFDTVLNDYKVWAPHILPGGYLLMHDIYEDPQKGGQAPYWVYRQALASGRYRGLAGTGSLGVLQRQR